MLPVARDDHVLLLDLEVSDQARGLHLRVLDLERVHLAQQPQHVLLVLGVDPLWDHLQRQCMVEVNLNTIGFNQ